MKAVVCLPLLLIALALHGQDSCALKLDKDSIRVYACRVTTSKFKAVRAVFPIKAKYSQLAAMVLDIENYHLWNYETSTVTILKKVSPTEIIYHTEVNAPYPASNRDFVIRLTLQQDPATRTLLIRAISIPTYIPEKPRIVRVPFSSATWIVKEAGPGELLVDYGIEIDLGGSVPAWLVNMLAHQAPYETFRAMREQIGNYAGRRVEFVAD